MEALITDLEYEEMPDAKEKKEARMHIHIREGFKPFIKDYVDANPVTATTYSDVVHQALGLLKELMEQTGGKNAEEVKYILTHSLKPDSPVKEPVTPVTTPTNPLPATPAKQPAKGNGKNSFDAI